MNPRHYMIYCSGICIEDIEADSHTEAREMCTARYTGGESLRLVHADTGEEIPEGKS